LPETNREFWRIKLEKNKERDRIVNRSLRANGWRILRFWQHELRQQRRMSRRLKTIRERMEDCNQKNSAHEKKEEGTGYLN
jgi:G:T-mismatch repair DNA endonuclease (very short patch repair protein)